MAKFAFLFIILVIFGSVAYLQADVLFNDDFEDNDASDWSTPKGTWTAIGGSLNVTYNRKADGLAPYIAQPLCTIETVMQLNTSGSRVSLLGWYQDKSNYVEVRLMDDKDKLLLRQRAGGTNVAKKSIPFAISSAVSYTVAVTYTNSQFDVSVNGSPVLSVSTSSVPFGRPGFRLKSTAGEMASASFEQITVTGDPSSGSWSTVNDFAYQLQNLNLTQMGNSAFDLVIMDYSADGTDQQHYTAQEIATLKSSPGGPKLVLAYMSIGEAENYRWYWQNNWDADNDGVPDAGAPAWLGLSNPEWEGNYKVRYWDPNWKSIIYGSNTSYLDKIIEVGFDGVYLDIIDAFEYWGPGGESGEERTTAAQDMVDFVLEIANYARVTKGVPGFGVFPQNGETLADFPNYVAAVTGIGREDTWYDGNQSQPPSETNFVLQYLDVFKNAGKLILVTDYVTMPALIDNFYSLAQNKGYVPYATVRDLDQLTINPSHEPD